MGPKWGSMLGLLFFWAQVIAAAMYSVGVAEVLVDLFSDYGKNYFTGEEVNDVRVVSVCVLTFLLAISFLGMGGSQDPNWAVHHHDGGHHRRSDWQLLPRRAIG